jgi:predicted hotdog family 3-hydroxylacyl-ACP dehydratase
MAAHLEDASVQEEGCRVMMRLIETSIEFNPMANSIVDPVDQVAAAGGIECVLSAMTAHPKVGSLQVKGCKLLWLLAANGDPEIRKQMLAAGAIRCVVQAMAVQLEVARVQEEGCGVMLDLFGQSANGIVEAGSITRVVSAMAAHTAVAGVQEHGCKLLTVLAMDHANGSGHVHSIVEAGGIELVVQAMAVHPSVESVQQEGCRALGWLCRGGSHRRAVEALEQHPAIVIGETRRLLENLKLETTGGFSSQKATQKRRAKQYG